MWRESDDETNYGKFKRWLQRGEARRESPNHLLIFNAVELHIMRLVDYLTVLLIREWLCAIFQEPVRH